MKLSIHHIPTEMMLRQMDLWYRTPLGICLLEAERTMLATYWKSCFGKHVLQIGGPGEFLLSPSNPPFYFLRLTPERMPIFKGISVRGQLDELPFLPESLTLILLPHLLEFATDPQKILAQSYQALAPGGRLIIFGFNPWSLWGLFKIGSYSKTLPWRGHFRSLPQLKKWLIQQDFLVVQSRALFFRPPCTQRETLARLAPMETLGAWLWRKYGGVNFLMAKKQMTPLMPIQESAQYTQLSAQPAQSCLMTHTEDPFPSPDLFTKKSHEQ